MIFLLIIAVIAIIALLPVTLRVSFDGKFKYGVYVWVFRLPSGKKKPSQKPEKKAVSKKKFDVGLGSVSRIVPKLVKHALSSMTVTKLDLDITVATDDPCDTAILYGTVNSAVYTLLEIAQNHLKIKNKKISVNADYDADTIKVGFEAYISTNVSRLAVCFIRLVSDGLLKELI